MPEQNPAATIPEDGSVASVTSRTVADDSDMPAWLLRGSVPCLDGLRAVSIGLVLLCHVVQTPGFPALPLRSAFLQGAIGVDVFFCISGFLITMLLLRELRSTGSISLKGFYIRRVLRIVPAYLAFIAALFVLTRLGGLTLSGWDWLSLFTYTANYHENRAWEIGHIWSLSLEEQFYLLWPLALFLAKPKQARWILVGYLLAAPVLRPLCRILFPDYRALAYSSTFTRMDSISVGCLLALLAFDRKVLPWLRVSRRAAYALGMLAIAALTVSLALRTSSRAYGISVAHSINALAIGVLVWVVVDHNSSMVGRLLAWRPLAVIGILSYSLYLWQQLFLNPHNPAWACGWPWNLVLAGLAAVASYLFVESPFLALKSKLAASKKAPHSVGGVQGSSEDSCCNQEFPKDRREQAVGTFRSLPGMR